MSNIKDDLYYKKYLKYKNKYLQLKKQIGGDIDVVRWALSSITGKPFGEFNTHPIIYNVPGGLHISFFSSEIANLEAHITDHRFVDPKPRVFLKFDKKDYSGKIKYFQNGMYLDPATGSVTSTGKILQLDGTKILQTLPTDLRYLRWLFEAVYKKIESDKLEGVRNAIVELGIGLRKEDVNTIPVIITDRYLHLTITPDNVINGEGHIKDTRYRDPCPGVYLKFNPDTKYSSIVRFENGMLIDLSTSKITSTGTRIVDGIITVEPIESDINNLRSIFDGIFQIINNGVIGY